jgi:hypothetical protein
MLLNLDIAVSPLIIWLNTTNPMFGFALTPSGVIATIAPQPHSNPRLASDVSNNADSANDVYTSKHEPPHSPFS